MSEYLDKIRQRRSQMLIHSYLYYHMDNPIISDDQWQVWANELADLQTKYPEPIGFYDKEFRDWDGSTGMHLPADSYVVSKATQILGFLNKNVDFLQTKVQDSKTTYWKMCSRT